MVVDCDFQEEFFKIPGPLAEADGFGDVRIHLMRE
jgi:hypothetical protein